MEFPSGFGLGRFVHTRGRIAPYTWFGLGDLQGHVGGRGQGDRVAVEKNHRNGHPLLEVLPVVIDLVRGQLILFETLVVHEDKRSALVVEELCFEFLDVSNFEIVPPLERSVQDRVADEVFKFAFVERIALPWFDEVDLGQQIGFAVDLNF